jgi:hypothetical protein
VKNNKHIVSFIHINPCRIHIVIAISILLSLSFSIVSDLVELQKNNDSALDSISSIAESSPKPKFPEYPSSPSDSEWVETENEVEGIVHYCLLRSEAPVWQIQNRYTILNNQVCSIFQPEYTPPPPRQIA